MFFAKAALVALTIGSLALSAPAFAAGEGKNAESGHQGRNASGDPSDVTGPQCFTRDTAGNETTIVCPETNPNDTE